ncbi:MAG: hypothetical protein A2Y12_20500 [Planctomycetes bacterium GWF2_42_9]|nr:MAG: hypothetical protein A2Y12_20500 [Planctomycetes bacterium GWF2_42_9]
MAIEFDTNKFNRIKRDGCDFWEGNLKRPLIQAYLSGRNAQESPAFENQSELLLFFDKNVSPEVFVDVWERKLSNITFMGDSFPYIRPLIGSSAMAVYVDANYIIDKDTVWFEPPVITDLRNIEIRYNPENIWFKKTIDIYSAAIKRWQGAVQPIITNLGGVFDILAMIVPANDIVLAMYDQPDQIKRLTWQIHKVWWQYYDVISQIIRPSSIGFMDFWLPIPCQKPSFLLQCDFCCLLNEKLFDEFVKPEIEESCNRLGGAMFHLDGPGAIRHLDSLLSIDNLKVIQWVPGDGEKDVTEWPELYQKVRNAGKQLFITGEGTRGNFDKIVNHLCSSEGLAYLAYGNVNEKTDFQKWLSMYDVPV